ncbi:MAG: hypothetical protein ACOC44_17525 [Promethearchaeia archaeon]
MRRRHKISEEGLIKIKPSAFMKIALHTFRFWQSPNSPKNQMVVGLLLGYLEDTIRHVEDVVPFTHTEKRSYEMDDKFMAQIGQINKQQLELNSVNEVIGWYRSTNEKIRFRARDIKNHIKFQNFNSKFIGLIFSPEDYLQPEEYGFSVFRLVGKDYYNMMSDYRKIPWEIVKLEDPNMMVHNFQGFIKNYFQNKPLIEEYTE